MTICRFFVNLKCLCLPEIFYIMLNNNIHAAFQKLDLRKIFANKNPKLARYIPGFIYKYLNRVLHISEINIFLEKNGEKMNYDFVTAVIENFNVTTTFLGIENLPDRGRYIFVSNHPLGGFDGMILIKMLHEKYGAIKSISNDILMNIKNMADLFVPINKHGNQSTVVARNFEEIMRSEVQILTFPAGLVSRRRKGIIRDIPWKKSFISKSVLYKRDIVPIYVSGRCTDFFYTLANIRKFFRIKPNLEMFYLPDETFHHKNKHFTITIGPAISWQSFDKSKRPDEWALILQDYVYSLPGGKNTPFDPGKAME
jgi:1-acyl-sn-glycerol-3-phosphate acyltransferase